MKKWLALLFVVCLLAVIQCPSLVDTNPLPYELATARTDLEKARADANELPALRQEAAQLKAENERLQAEFEKEAP